MVRSLTAKSEPRRRLTIEEIDAIDDRPEIEVDVPEWNHGTVAIRALTATQITLARARAWDARKKTTDDGVLNAWCLEMGVIDPKLSFAKAKTWLDDKSFGSVNTILSELMSASGRGVRAEEAAKSEPGAESATGE